MGNSPPSGGVLGNSDHSYVVDIGKRASIVFKGRKVGLDSDGVSNESWTMVYNAGTSNCVLILSKTLWNHYSTLQPDKKLVIEINDTSNGIYNFLLNLQRDEAGLLHHYHTSGVHDYKEESGLQCFNSCNTDAHGNITENYIYIYGIGKRRGLVVVEWKKKGKDQNPYSGNGAHYFVSYENGLDVGLSVAIKRIRASPNNDAIDYVVNGPEKHPADALDYMIRQVHRTQSWKPTDCPHCANKYIIRQGQSDTESDADNAPPPPFQSRGPSTGALVSNPGRFKGKNIGNTYINRFYGRRRW